jgi:hypothetical protein
MQKNIFMSWYKYCLFLIEDPSVTSRLQNLPKFISLQSGAKKLVFQASEVPALGRE